MTFFHFCAYAHDVLGFKIDIFKVQGNAEPVPDYLTVYRFERQSPKTRDAFVFTIDPKDQLKTIKDMRENGLKPLGNWHSHPESPSRPSEEDKRLANDSKASYLILSLMEEGNPVLNAFHVETVDGEKTVRKEELIIKEDE